MARNATYVGSMSSCEGLKFKLLLFHELFLTGVGHIRIDELIDCCYFEVKFKRWIVVKSICLKLETQNLLILTWDLVFQF